MTESRENGHGSVVELERAEWLQRLADAARAASDGLRALEDPMVHRTLIEDLDAFRDRLVAELEAPDTGGDP